MYKILSSFDSNPLICHPTLSAGKNNPNIANSSRGFLGKGRRDKALVLAYLGSPIAELFPHYCLSFFYSLSYYLDLRALRKKNVSKLIIAHLNVNSSRNKLEFLKEQIQDIIDILMISETKIDTSFPIGQFLLNVYSTPFRQDRNAHGGGILYMFGKIFLQSFYLWKKILLKAFLWRQTYKIRKSGC